jgi:peptidoglycan/xylan/chitin deacetylase (PgdA/CDA1 family)
MLHLLVGIDTEGDNQWSAAARANPTFENIYALPRLHDFFLRHGVRPTYVVTYPVATDPRSADVLARLAVSGTCEIGAHHHAWETPPSDPGDVERHPYALELPAERFAAQLHNLTRAIEGAVGRRPTSYRSGRFGFSASHVSALEDAGYLVESSVAPLFYEAHKGGPDFVDAPLEPYFLAYDDPSVPGSSNLLELPLSAALDRQVPAALARLYGRLPRPYTSRRLLRLARVARVLWLRPSYCSADDMMTLARRLAGRGVPLLNLLFHSSEALAGCSPYNRTEADLDAFLDRLGRFLTFATTELAAGPATFHEFRGRYSDQNPALRPAGAPVAGQVAARR